MKEIRAWDAPRPADFFDGEILVGLGGHFHGKTLRVDGASSYWTRETYYFGDPAQGICSKEGYQIVLDIEIDGEWVYAIREHEDAISRFFVRTDEALAAYEARTATEETSR